MKQQVDRNKPKREFEVGEWIFVKLQPYKQLSLKQKGKNKLAPRFYGLYQINKKINQVTYNLILLDRSCVHNVFHVSCLKKALGKYQSIQKTLSNVDDK